MKHPILLRLLIYAALAVCISAKAQDADLSELLKRLHDPALPAVERIAAARELTVHAVEQPFIVKELCRETRLRSPNVPNIGSGRSTSTGLSFPITAILSQMGQPALPGLMDAYAEESDANSRGFLGMPMAYIIDKFPASRSQWLERYALVTDPVKQARLRAFGEDILLIKDFPMPKIKTEPSPQQAIQETPPPPEKPSSISPVSLSPVSVPPATAADRDPLKISRGPLYAVFTVMIIVVLWLLRRKILAANEY